MNIDPNSFFIDDVFKMLDKYGAKSKGKMKSVKKKSASKKKNKKLDETKLKPTVCRDSFGRKLIETKYPVNIELTL